MIELDHYRAIFCRETLEFILMPVDTSHLPKHPCRSSTPDGICTPQWQWSTSRRAATPLKTTQKQQEECDKDLWVSTWSLNIMDPLDRSHWDIPKKITIQMLVAWWWWWRVLLCLKPLLEGCYGEKKHMNAINYH